MVSRPEKDTENRYTTTLSDNAVCLRRNMHFLANFVDFEKVHESLDTTSVFDQQEKGATPEERQALWPDSGW